MPEMFRPFVVLIVLGFTLSARDFDPRRDAFAFSNETVLKYSVNEAGRLQIGRRETEAVVAHSCFLFTRSVMQFWKFARFEPRMECLSEDEYRGLLRSLFRIPVWSARAERIVFPGYADLWEFSRAHARLVQGEWGSWQLTYLRPGNWRMACPLVRFMQRGIAEELFAEVSRGRLRAVYLADFPHMNHAVIAYAAQRLAAGRIRFRVYDPNYAGESARLDYVPARNLFDFERRFYWPGGELRAFPVYTSPLR
jgi:hypothetical protein